MEVKGILQNSQPESVSTQPEDVNRRLKRNMLVSALLFSIVAIFFAGKEAALGVVTGACLSYLNYRWLHTGLQAILDLASTGQAVPSKFRTASKFIFRWLVIGSAIWVASIYLGNRFVVYVIVGLFVFGTAAMIEAFTQAKTIFSTKSSSAQDPSARDQRS